MKWLLLFCALVSVSCAFDNVHRANVVKFNNPTPIAVDGIAPIPTYFHVGGGGTEDQVDVIGTIQDRLNTFLTGLAQACCDNPSECSSNYCMRSCPPSCWVTGWSVAPSVSITSFTIDSTNPASYTPQVVVPQNYTNYSKTQTTSAQFTYSEAFTDTVTVENSQTLTVSMSVETKVDIDILSEDVTVGFSYSTTQDTSVTNSTTKTWGIQFGPAPIPPCTGLYVECFIMAANFNPSFTATYSVDGTPTDKCNGNWYWDGLDLSDYAEGVCIECNPYVCPNVTLDNTIVVNGVWQGILGAEVQCTDKPFNLPPEQCS